MRLTIYEMAHSPYCIPITQALTALDQPFEREAVPNWDRQAIIELTQGAYYQVPVLQHGDRIIHESSDTSLDVARYIDKEFANGRLFPSDTAGLDELLIEHIENDMEGLGFRLCDIHYLDTIDDLNARTAVIRHKERRFGRDCVEQWRAQADELRASLAVMLDRFDRALQQRSFIMLDHAPCYVDFALLGVIGNFTHGGHETLPQDQAALRAWHERILAFRY